MPLVRRIPKRGFTHVRTVETEIVNLRDLNRFPASSVVDPAALLESGLVTSPRSRVKILGDGSVDRGLTVRAHRFSGSAREKIVAAGGQAEEVPC